MPVNSFHPHTKSGDKADTISTLVKRLFITDGLSLCVVQTQRCVQSETQESKSEIS